MTEHAVLALLGIASVATAITGFSGVVAVFGGRAEGKWSAPDRFRTKNMLILSLGACLLSFVPLMEELFQIADRTIWITSSSLMIAFCAVYFVTTMIGLRSPALRRPGALIYWVRIVYFICLALAIALQVLNVGDAFPERGSAPYVTGLIFILIPAALQFAFLVLTPLTEPPSEN